MSTKYKVRSSESKLRSAECGVRSAESRACAIGKPAAPVVLSPCCPVALSFFCRLCSVSCLLLSIILLPACGRKTAVRPPELVAPEPIVDLAAEVQNTGVRLRWSRPQKYVDGSDMDDLGGFVVLRATQTGQGNAESFTQVATVPVEDRDRFRKAKKFSYTDEQLAIGTRYRYRVQAFTLDGYYSSPSNTAELAWPGGS
jgi:hypothetical protein